MFKSDSEFVKRYKSIAEKALHRTHEFVFPGITDIKDGKRQILDEPPLIYHPTDYEKLIESGHVFFDAYFRSLSNDKKALLNRYRFEDIALKVFGLGSVGTRCLIGLFSVRETDAIILQFKEGNHSVLEKYAGKSAFENQGERIVNGQHLMQTVSDIFLGWSRTKDGNDFYVRQLRDMKSSAHVDNFTPKLIVGYASLCGWALAKSHAKAGWAAEISGYLGKVIFLRKHSLILPCFKPIRQKMTTSC